ncbi:unnamed protein product [Allacma fusca]|uniref:CRAL-TRIO domain-containing protein n=1 Tax=Allacma fusca TaxID=39272 RepID=A0A8J2JT71_9HEXA|nr:unnamed protein product [Allacma fusca]
MGENTQSLGFKEFTLTKFIWYCFTLILLLTFPNSAGGQIDFKLALSAFNAEDFQKILEWEAPTDIQDEQGYFLSGYDYEGVPIWISEFRKWKLRKKAVTPEGTRNYQLYQLQFLSRCLESAKHTPGNEFNLILDMEGYSTKQTGTSDALDLQIWAAQQYAVAFRNLKQATIVNGNFIVTTILRLTKPLLGSAGSKLDTFGTNQNKWVSYLRSKYPVDQLPERFGGSRNHVPVMVYGLDEKKH